MKSIRLSLLVYFLLLLGLALGAVSLLVYQITQQTLLARKEKTREVLLDKKESTQRLLKDKQATTQDLLKAQNKDRVDEEEAKLDKALLAEAQTLGPVAIFQYQFSRARFTGLYMLGLLTACHSPEGYLLFPVWTAQGMPRSPLSQRINRMLAAEIEFNEEVLLTETRVTEYFQIDGEWGSLWRSESMEGRSFPQFSTPSLVDWHFDKIVLDKGVEVRRVTLKAPVARVRFPWGPPPDRPDRPPPRFSEPFVGPPAPKPEPFVGPPAPPGPERFSERSSPPIVIHCAASTNSLNLAISKHKFQLLEDLAQVKSEVDTESEREASESERELARLEVESSATLASLRNRLLLISLATFGAIVVGGFCLVRHGLAPLRRLSEAVSKVSAQDIRLQFEKGRIPNELRPIVDRLHETLDLLKRAFAREKQAAADISHELRTPLTALLTTVELALRKTRTPEEYRELFENCRLSGQQMSQLVEHLLTLARLDAGVDMLRPRPVDGAHLARQCATLVRPLAEARGLTLQVQCEEPAALTADADKLREILTNLLHNAIEYNCPEGKVELTVARQNGHLLFEVRDSGVGIAPEAREHIFERFYRADPSRQADGLHAGLGLSIVKGYVDLMGGTIAVESEIGKGSRFKVELPVRNGDQVTG